MKLTTRHQVTQIAEKKVVGESHSVTDMTAYLEQALAIGDVEAVKQHLRAGADPSRVSVQSFNAARTDGAAACVQLIRVAARLQRMGVARPPATREGNGEAFQVPAQAVTARARFADLLARNLKKKPTPVLERPITNALLEYDLMAANTALTRSQPPEYVFLKKNIDHLNGLLAFDDQVKLKSLHRSGMLESALSSVQPPGTKAMLKQFSYASHKPGRSSRVTFNNAVTFRGSEQVIECRHLAMHWLLDRPVGKDGKRDYTKLSSTRKVQTSLRNQTDATFTSFRITCKEAHLVDIDKFGDLLASQFRELVNAGSGAPPKRMLIISDNHAMACELKYKHDENGHPVYAVSFYDPNLTTTHRRVRMNDLAAVAAISMHDLVNDPRRMSEYYKDQSVTMVMVVPDDLQVTDSSLLKPRIVSETIGNRRLTSGSVRSAQAISADGERPNGMPSSDISANRLFQLLDNDFAGELPQAFEQIHVIADVEQQVAILAAVNSQGVPALAKLFVEGDSRTQAVSLFTTAVLSSDALSSRQKTKLLAAQFPEPFAIRGFLAALGGGQTQVLTTFMRLILDSPALSPQEKYSLLEVRATTDTDFLKDLINDGHGNAVIAYKEALARSSLSAQMIRDMQTHA